MVSSVVPCMLSVRINLADAVWISTGIEASVCVSVVTDCDPLD